jgi:lipoprotein-anchoring transpeptidase ErfK/SrfK
MRTIAGTSYQVILLACVLSLSAAGPCFAQGWPSWADEIFGTGRGRSEPRQWRDSPGRNEPQRDWDRPSRSEPRDSTASGGDVRDGGPRPVIAPAAPAMVAFDSDYPANSIVIDTGARALYYVLAEKRAYRYPISVGREGFNWTGTESISRKQAWPDWYPPAEMRERDSSLPEKMTGGLKNPLGAMALYLGNTLYRIHGTNDVKSIGQAQSSGCFRMLNSAVMHLSSVAEVGTPVAVVTALPARREIGRAEEPAASPPKAQTAAPTAASPNAPGKPPSAAPPAQTPPPAAASERLPDYQTLRDYALQPR